MGLRRLTNECINMGTAERPSHPSKLNMKARDIFGIILRTIGVCLLLFSLWYLAFGVAYLLRTLQETSNESTASVYFTTGVPGFTVAVLLLCFSRQIVRFSYPGNKDDSED
jgi:hypothetical protein